MSAIGDLAPARRLLIATAVARYRRNPGWNRPGLVQARQQIIDLFAGTFGYTLLPQLGLDPTAQKLTNQLRAVCKRLVRPQDYLVVYLAGHGEVLDDGAHVLLTSDTDPDDLTDALPTSELARKMLRGTDVQRMLLLLDTCYSGQGGNEFAAAVLAGLEHDWTLVARPGLTVVTSAQPSESATTGAFPRLLSEAVHGLPTAGRAPAALSIGAVVEAMNGNESRPGHQQIGWAALGLTGEQPDYLPNPRHRAGMTDIDLHLQQVAEWERHAERREIEFRRRFLIRAMGGHGPEPSWWFAGRRTALTDIAAWLATPAASSPVLAITGGPGSGKTAVLGLVSALSHPEHRRVVPRDALNLPDAAVPPLEAVDVTIYAGGLTDQQVLGGLAAAARVSADTVGTFILTLQGKPNAAARPFTAIIDALDEAANPQALISRVLRPLAEAGSAFRMLLGIRTHLLRLLIPAEGSSASAVTAAVTTIGLDEPRYADPEALRAYTIRGLLEASSASPFLGASPTDVRRVADAVAAAASPSFLVARITATTLAAAGTVPDVTDPAWRSSLPRLPGEAIRRDLDSRLVAHAQRARDLLRPLAFAEGQGLPWENVWAPLASRISGRSYTDSDLFWLREHAGSYIVEASEDGRSSYRLYHQALTEHLRADTEAAGIETATVHRAFVEVLTRVPPTSAATRDWSRAHPYALRHLATHAAAAGLLDSLLEDGGYLIHADPEALLAVLDAASTAHGRLVAKIYRTSADQHRRVGPSVRRQLLAVDAARHKAWDLGSSFRQAGGWHPRWATGALISPALRACLPHLVPVRSAACAKVDGTPVLIAGGGNDVGNYGELVIWDLRTGQQRATLPHHSLAVQDIVCTEVDGVPVAVTVAGCPIAKSTGEVWVWNLRTGQRLASFDGHPGGTYRVVCQEISGSPVALSYGAIYEGRDPGVRAWDLRTLRSVDPTWPRPPKTNVACVDGTLVNGTLVKLQPQGSEVLVTDVATGEHRFTLAGHTLQVTSIACADVDGDPVAVTGAGNFHGDTPGEVRLWDLRTGQARGSLSGHQRSVNTVTCTEVGGVPVAITGAGSEVFGGGEEVRIWDLRAAAAQDTADHHNYPVRAVACASAGDRTTVLTGAGSGDGHGEAGFWLLPGPIADGTVPPIVADAKAQMIMGTVGPMRYPVMAVAFAEVDQRPVLLSGGGLSGSGAELVMTDMQLPADFPLGRPTLRINGIACAKVDGAPLAVIGAGTDMRGGGASIWDLRAQRRRMRLARRAQINAVACTTIDGLPVAVGGGAVAGRGYIEPGLLWVWDLHDGRWLGTLRGHRRAITAITCLDIDGTPVALSGSGGPDRYGELIAWDLRSRQRQHVFFRGDGLAVDALAYLYLDGTPLAVAGLANNIGGGELQIWNLQTRQLLETIAVPHAIGALAVTPGNELVVGAAQELLVFTFVPAGPTDSS